MASVRRPHSRLKFVVGNAGLAAVGAGIRASAAQFEFKCSSSMPVEHPAIVRGKQMWAAIGRESGGRIRAEIFPSSTLGTDVGVLSQVRLGAVQFQCVGGGPLQGVVPAADITNVGFAFKDEDEAFRVCDGPVGDYVRKEMTAKGLHGLHDIWDSGMRQITSGTHPIRTAEDMNGFKIRITASKITVDFFKALGADPTSLDLSATYTALQTKIVDGTDSPLATVETSRLFEAQKYLSLTNHTWVGLWWIANGDVWKSLPPDLADIIERNVTMYGALQRRDAKLLNLSVTDKLARQGLILNRVDPASFRARLRSYYDAWRVTFGATEWGLLQAAIGGKLN